MPAWFKGYAFYQGDMGANYFQEYHSSLPPLHLPLHFGHTHSRHIHRLSHSHRHILWFVSAIEHFTISVILSKMSHPDLHGNGKAGVWEPGLRRVEIRRNSTNSLHYLSSMNGFNGSQKAEVNWLICPMSFWSWLLAWHRLHSSQRSKHLSSTLSLVAVRFVKLFNFSGLFPMRN